MGILFAKMIPSMDCRISVQGLIEMQQRCEILISCVRQAKPNRHEAGCQVPISLLLYPSSLYPHTRYFFAFSFAFSLVAFSFLSPAFSIRRHQIHTLDTFSLFAFSFLF